MKTEDENLLFVCEEYLSCSKTTLQKQTGCQWFSADLLISPRIAVSLIRVKNNLRSFHRNSSTIERACSTVEFLHQETPDCVFFHWNYGRVTVRTVTLSVNLQVWYGIVEFNVPLDIV